MIAHISSGCFIGEYCVLHRSSFHNLNAFGQLSLFIMNMANYSPDSCDKGRGVMNYPSVILHSMWELKHNPQLLTLLGGACQHIGPAIT